MRVRATAAEVEVINAAAAIAERLRSAGHPDWYLRGVVDKLIERAWVPNNIRDDVAARAIAILRGFNVMRPARAEPGAVTARR
jgi:hypothetical protein